MKKILLSLLLLPFLISAEIVELSTMEAIRNKVGPLDSETLVVFDIENTLTIPADTAFQLANIKEHRALIHSVTKNWSSEKKLVGLNYSVLHESVLLDNATGNWIWMLQENDIPVMAFSNTLTSPLGTVTNPPLRKESLLRGLNVDLRRSAPHKNFIVLKECKPLFSTYPLYHNGILHGNGNQNTKGEVFAAFLQQLDWKPKQVIFIDDTRPHVDSMKTALEKLGIAYLGIHYTGIHRTTDISRNALHQQWETLNQVTKNIMEQKTTCSQVS